MVTCNDKKLPLLINRTDSSKKNTGWVLCFAILLMSRTTQAQDIELWDKSASGKEHPNIQWFKEAKFGMFIHWGLYSKLAGVCGTTNDITAVANGS